MCPWEGSLVTFVMDEYNIIGCSLLQVQISNEVWRIWNKYRQTSIFSREACGVLIGGFEPETKTFFVEQCTQPMKSDRRKRTSFILCDYGHQKEVDKAFHITGGKCFYLGTWHTHPESHPSPSYLDEKDWNECIGRNPTIPGFLFAIVGTKSVSLFPKGKITNYEFQNS